MATIHIVRRHHMNMDELRAEIDKLAAKLGQQLGADYQWQGDALSFKRTGASGHIHMDAEQVSVEVELGLLLRPLKGTVEDAIKEYLDEHVS